MAALVMWSIHGACSACVLSCVRLAGRALHRECAQPLGLNSTVHSRCCLTCSRWCLWQVGADVVLLFIVVHCADVIPSCTAQAWPQPQQPGACAPTYDVYLSLKSAQQVCAEVGWWTVHPWIAEGGGFGGLQAACPSVLNMGRVLCSVQRPRKGLAYAPSVF